MKIFFVLVISLVTSLAYSSEDFRSCTEAIKVIDNFFAETLTTEKRIRNECSSRNEERFEEGSSCHIALIRNDIAQRILQQSMQKIQEYCAQRYGQQQQHHIQPFLRKTLSEDEILNTRYNIILICEGPKNIKFESYVDRNDCLLPSGNGTNNLKTEWAVPIELFI